MAKVWAVTAAATLAVLAGCGSAQDHPAVGRTASTATATPPQPVAPPTTTRPAQAERTTGGRVRHLHYTFPVHGCSASPSSSHHDYPASDIFTQRGCKFVAVTRGTVDEVSFRDRWDPQVDAGATRGGLSVSIVGDDGVRYYGSHLLRIAPGIKPGARVHTGDVLGRIDNSGDAKYTPTHVHFGISWPSRPGKWWVRRGEVWPQRFLTAWRQGDDLSPTRAVRRAHRRIGSVPRCTVLC